MRVCVSYKPYPMKDDLFYYMKEKSRLCENPEWDLLFDAECVKMEHRKQQEVTEMAVLENLEPKRVFYYFEEDVYKRQISGSSYGTYRSFGKAAL